jgi:ABC-type nitrate/sulfonate/bicarbonate transport system permease component
MSVTPTATPESSPSPALPLRAIRRRRTTGREVAPLRGLLPLIAALVVWELIAQDQSAYFPRPSLWWDAVGRQWDNGALWPALVATVKSFVYALVLATVVGTVTGIAIGASRRLDRTLGPFLDYCRFMPAAAIVPVAVLFAGYTERMKLIVVVFAAVWPVLLQVRSGLRSQSPLLRDVARSLHLSRWSTVRKVLLPSLVPSILLGVRIAAPIVLIVVLLVEIVTQVTGLGGLISNAQRAFDASTAYGLLAIAGCLGVAVNAFVGAIEARLRRYRTTG